MLCYTGFLLKMAPAQDHKSNFQQCMNITNRIKLMTKYEYYFKSYSNKSCKILVDKENIVLIIYFFLFFDFVFIYFDRRTNFLFLYSPTIVIHNICDQLLSKTKLIKHYYDRQFDFFRYTGHCPTLKFRIGKRYGANTQEIMKVKL